MSAGTYVENINYNGKNIVVGSLYLTTQDMSYISSTIIDGNQAGSVVTFENSEDSTASLVGFSITNGSGNLGQGGGIYINGSYPILKSLNINNNTASTGAGLFAIEYVCLCYYRKLQNTIQCGRYNPCNSFVPFR